MNPIKKATILLSQELKHSILGRIYPEKPTTLNLLVNDVCNSKCQMCLIWKNKLDKEFTPKELEKILSDDLFSKLTYIGVSGGEPTLRMDLPEIFKALCRKKPALKGIGIITNGIITNTVKPRLKECSAICKSFDIPFAIMISIDGMGDVHDVVRGRPGNFDSSMSLLKYFRDETDIPVSFGCTITKSNAFYVDELLDFAIHEKFYGRFRIAEFIERLYNNQQVEYIRAFDGLEAYHLGLFFHRLEKEFELNPTYKKTYRNIRKMIVEGSPRLIGCPYQSNAVVVTSRGDLLYCSPKSPVLGNILTRSAKSIYFSNLFIRDKIKNNDCKNCIHDYHDPLTLREYINREKKYRLKKFSYNLDRLLKKSRSLNNAILRTQKNIDSVDSKQVLIVGWYGTETVGDKAILWSILEDLRNREAPPEKVYVSSLFPFITSWTLKELQLNNLENISIVETYSSDFSQVSNKVDEVIVGGGPLMDLEVLDHILFAFICAAKRGKITRICGCGIGPLNSFKYSQAVAEIIRLSNFVTLRDSASVERCVTEFKDKNAIQEGDPAIKFVEFFKANPKLFPVNHIPFSPTTYIACFLREWGKDYSYGLSEHEYISQKNIFEKNLAEMIDFIAQEQMLNINLLPMHSFHVGGDDRIFNRNLSSILNALKNKDKANNLRLQVNINSAVSPISPAEVIANMMGAKMNLCMRFHSVLFAETLNVPYIAIDYTRGGKIEAFLRDKGKLSRMLTIEEIASGMWKHKAHLFSPEN